MQCDSWRYIESHTALELECGCRHAPFMHHAVKVVLFDAPLYRE